MIYIFTELRLNIHWGQCNLSLWGGLLTFSLLMSFIKDFKIFFLVKKGTMNFFKFPYSSNHSLLPFLDLFAAEYTIDAKVDPPASYSYLRDCLKEPKLTSNLIELNLLVVGLGIHWIGILLQVWKVKVSVSLVPLSLPFRCKKD